MTTTAESSQRTDGKPTVVLVHGPFADASSWNGVIERLQHQGYTVVAPANPPRGVATDAAYLASVVNQLDSPVLLVGHSYGGALITNAATAARNVVGLVYYPTGPGGQTAPELLVDPGRFREVFAADLPAERTAVMAAGVEGSHVIMVSQPQAVVDLIVKVARAVSASGR